MSFSNKVVLVTGASSGIGAAIALKFGEEGANVVIVARNDKKLKIVAERVEKAGGTTLSIIADVSNDNDVKRIINDTIKKFGKLDVLINNAGMVGGASIMAENALEVFDQLMNTNVRSIVHLTNLASKYLVESKGNIINISSIAGIMASAGAGFTYSTSKAAVDHFTRTIAAELAPNGVRANTINPGPVKTDIFENSGSNAQENELAWESLKNITALKRVSEPSEIAELALFLASDKAVAITGATFVADNGVLVN